MPTPEPHDPAEGGTLRITVLGAGIVGLWQAYMLAYHGHQVRLVERSATPFATSASQLAGAMLAPFCEREVGGPQVQELGLRALGLWTEVYPGVVCNGTLVLALPRDRAELDRFAARTEGHRRVGAEDLAGLEPRLAGRFADGLLYAQEAHLEPGAAMAFLLRRIRRLGVQVSFAEEWERGEEDRVIDCRGLAARDELPALRGVRGERVVVQTHEVEFARPVRLLHPRHSLYVVPWGSGTYMLGATSIESDDSGPVRVKSALDLLGMAYALHPAFGQARVVSLDAGVRPSFPSNLPRIVLDRDAIRVNGMYRHGFLLAPVLAEMVAAHLRGLPVDRTLFAASTADCMA